MIKKTIFLCLALGVSLGAFAAEASLPSVPAHRPRVFLRPDEVPGLAARFQHPALKTVVERMQRAFKRHGFHRIEWEVLNYMVTPDAVQGRKIIADTIEMMKKSELSGRQDATRFTGRIMVTGAIVYDWLYPLLTPGDKKVFIAELVRLAKTQECGYPPKPGSVITGHGSEAMIIRDMLAAGIAIYDEYPEMYELAAQQVINRIVPARNWFYPAHTHHQGDSYAQYRFQWEMFATYIFNRIGAKNLFIRDQAQVPYQWLYTTRPDGQRLRSGDTFRDSTAPGRPWGEYAGGMLAASYYQDPILMGQFLQQGGTYDDELFFDFIWRDLDLKPAGVAELPQSRYFGSPFGWMVARTGWDENAVVAEMKVNEYNFVNHQHLDAGAFQIYYRGALAIDSGLYQRTPEGTYGRTHTRNYSWRTIAHNTLLVYDPKENFGREGWVNDGGQRLPNLRAEPRDLEALLDPANGYRTGKVLAQGFGPDPQRPAYTLLQGDITAAYGPKVQQAIRSTVFLRMNDAQAPAAMLVYDRVTSADPAFKKIWLLHSEGEIALSGNQAARVHAAGDATGELDMTVLAPSADNAELTKVGGPGKEFWVFGQNYPNNPAEDVLAKSTIESGKWRLELSPKTPSARDVFLVALQTKKKGATPTAVQSIATADRVGALLQRTGESWLVLLRRTTERSAETVAVNVPENPGQTRVLLTDLSAGVWRATPVRGGGAIEFTVTKDAAAGYFIAAPGEWRIELTP